MSDDRNTVNALPDLSNLAENVAKALAADPDPGRLDKEIETMLQEIDRALAASAHYGQLTEDALTRMEAA